MVDLLAGISVAVAGEDRDAVPGGVEGLAVGVSEPGLVPGLRYWSGIDSVGSWGDLVCTRGAWGSSVSNDFCDASFANKAGIDPRDSDPSGSWSG